jgi:hypothetical protein
VACGRAPRERTDWNRFRLKVHTGPRPGLLFVVKRLHSRDSSLLQNPHISPKARDDRIFALHSPAAGSRHLTALPQSLSTFAAHVPRILSSALASASGSNVWGLLPARASRSRPLASAPQEGLVQLRAALGCLRQPLNTLLLRAGLSAPRSRARCMASTQTERTSRVQDD